jgi:hypothetical protein
MRALKNVLWQQGSVLKARYSPPMSTYDDTVNGWVHRRTERPPSFPSP